MICLRCSCESVAWGRNSALVSLLETGTARGGAAAFARGVQKSVVAWRSTASAACSNLACV